MPTLMIQGCTSDAGKTTIVAALCRILLRRGIKVAPFKPQNMALNSAVTSDAGEIGRAQAMQAVAAGIAAHTDFNPVLLKPSSDCRAQVIIQGKSIGNLDAVDYHAYKQTAKKAVFESWGRLQNQYEWVIVEGAGSPAEINLREGDIANMGFAEEADCPVWLVADIDRGGVFAHFVGTLSCLSVSEQARVTGFIINRFRGDIKLLQGGIDWLEQTTGKPVLAVVPYLHGLDIAAEDAVPVSYTHLYVNKRQALARDVVLELRLPRTLAAIAVGGLLALAGALQQVLLRNPLADPYILGTSGGASVGALLALLLGAGVAAVNLAAGCGALLSITLVFILARKDHSSSQARLLLTGVAIASFCGALSSLLLSLAPDGLLRGMVFWMLGDLAGARWQLALALLLALLLLVWPLARQLNVRSQGAQTAHALGANTRKLQWLLYFVAAAATAIAVTTAGMIGFIGLIVPHALRLVLGHDQRLLLPAVALTGGTVLLAADIASRIILAPQQLPVGVITALAGVPVFLWLLQHRGVAR